jgi:hypothetical protein
MYGETDRMEKKMVMLYFKILSHYSPRRTEEDDEKPQSKKLVLWLRFKPGTF